MMQIAGREISGDEPALVIAEIGVNHDGSEARALELVELAARAGADAVKLQVFRADALMNSAAAFADYQQQRCTDASPIEMLRRYELPADALRRIVEQIRRRGMIPLATPFSLGDVEILRELELPAIKIASPDIVNTPLLARCAGLGRPLLISTGAATLEEIDAAVESVHSANIPFALLHCISSYPAPDESANLCWIGELMARYGVAIGYSDHT
ncbi:MAG TPA: N-acetylneuraminate synthase family protein, partial [Tepidisphaeraceae bacterium]